MRFPLLCLGFASLLLTWGCKSEHESPGACLDWWRDGTWAQDTVTTDFTQPCRPVDQVCTAEPTTHGWTLLAEGLQAIPGGGVKSSSLRLDACSQPVLAWAEAYKEAGWSQFNRAALEVQRWTNGAWEPVGPQPVSTARQPDVLISLAMDPTLRPVVAMADGTGQPVVFAYDAPGSHSAIPLEQGLLPDSGTPVFSPLELRLEVPADGLPQMAIYRTYDLPHMGGPGDHEQFFETYRATPEAAGWGRMPLLEPFNARTLRVDAEGRSWIVQDRQLMRLENFSWSPVGPTLPSGTISDLQWSAVGHPVVLLFVGAPSGGGRFDLVELADSGAWEARTGPIIGLTRPNLARAQFRLESGTDQPVVAWGEYTFSGSPNYGVRVLRWSGDAWEPLGETPEVHAAAGRVFDVSLELNKEGHPTVAWHADPGPALWVARYRP